ncbi:hypothetical protein [Streptomyces sp. NPDC020141]|uniref:hypothetical protein n=1 Tax=Streptomyces sp. NPDC020141 TaxID=3365065 RepID=UPI0037982B7E
MRQRVRLLVAASLPPLLMGVWAVFVVLAGAGPAPIAGAVASAPAVTPAVPARTDGPSRTASARAEVRRAPVATVQEVVSSDPGDRPPLAPEAAEPPTAPVTALPSAGREAAGPRRERAPPLPVHGPRQTRAPPSSTSS